MTRPRDLRYSIDVYDARGNWLEKLGEIDDLDPARAAFAALCEKYPAKLIFLRNGMRTLAKSEEPPDWMANAIRIGDAQGRSAVYVVLKIDDKVVDSE